MRILKREVSALIYRTTALLLVAASSGQATQLRAEETYTAIFDTSFRTLKMWNPDDFMGAPVIRLGSEDRLWLTFDQLAYEREELAASIVHCNADWQPSALQETEYLDSFNFEDIEDFGYSTNTFQHYVNYRVEIPSEKLRPTKSGNYLLKVFPRDLPDETLLQARFQVVEPLVSTGGKVTTRTDRGADNHWQQLELGIDLRQLQVANPYTDLIVKVSQNGDPETSRTLAPPLRTDGNRISYAHQPALIFPAQNEFRRFETVRATFPGIGVDSVRFDNERYHAFLHTDHDRSEREYVYDQTQQGRFLIREYNATDSDLAADYITVHFSLDFPEIMNADVYVEGEMTGYRHDDSNRMRYDRESGLYLLEMPLKQGSYNYRYTVIGRDKQGNPGTSGGHPETIEGNHWETQNEYRVEVYHRPPGARADRLVGFATLRSNQ